MNCCQEIKNEPFKIPTQYIYENRLKKWGHPLFLLVILHSTFIPFGHLHSKSQFTLATTGNSTVYTFVVSFNALLLQVCKHMTTHSTTSHKMVNISTFVAKQNELKNA